MSQLNVLEEKLNKALVKDAPYQLPENAKKFIVKWIPIINLVLGVITLLAALSLWRWANTANQLVDYANNLSETFGGGQVADINRLSVMLWVGLIVLAVEGVLYIAAYPGTKAHKKSGWDLLFYAALLNAVYGIVVAFTDYGSVSNIISSLIGTLIGLYILFQIRGSYTGGKVASKPDEKKK